MGVRGFFLFSYFQFLTKQVRVLVASECSVLLILLLYQAVSSGWEGNSSLLETKPLMGAERQSDVVLEIWKIFCAVSALLVYLSFEHTRAEVLRLTLYKYFINV